MYGAHLLVYFIHLPRAVCICSSSSITGVETSEKAVPNGPVCSAVAADFKISRSLTVFVTSRCTVRSLSTAGKST